MSQDRFLFLTGQPTIYFGKRIFLDETEDPLSNLEFPNPFLDYSKFFSVLKNEGNVDLFFDWYAFSNYTLTYEEEEF